MCNFIKTNNMVLVNSTPHPIRLQMDEYTIVIPEPPVNQIINASIEVTTVDELLVKLVFVGNSEGETIINEIYSEFPNDRVIIIGSIIAAQAYPGKVFGMVPAEGYERRPPAEKLMRSDKFVTF